MSDLIIFFVAVFIAFSVTGLFFYGLWQMLHAFFSQPRIQAVVQEALELVRNAMNPILRTGSYHWEKESVLNPAIVEAGGRTHMFYRAVGADGVSRIGYASSKDGVNFDERLPFPVYAADGLRDGVHYRYDPVQYPSGGSWGGTEDPRAVIIDNKLYLTFNMFDGWDNMRVAAITLDVDDLINHRWNWSKPSFLSPAGERHKNWVLFPEKVNGQFALMHNLHTDDENRVRIEYMNDPMRIGADSPHIDSPNPHAMPDRTIAWHKRMRSIGPPPIKTAFGWLFLYHANDDETHKYKMGAALLDLLDPTKIIARAPLPVLVPDATYENEGKPGIVYGCGATIKDDTLRVYYGGGDNVVCSASAPIGSFLDTLMTHGTPQMALA
ncbi:MAG: hypothetical protein JWM39_679 [Parcubacteria group bacterium]|nr:hypothetical protein [Parcubacteria group bacterium]